MTSFERLQRSGLGSLDLLAQGGQARVYRAPGLSIPDERGLFVFKEYKNKRSIPINGLDGIAAFRQRLEEYDRSVLDVLTNWPLRVVEGDTGGTEGVIIPLIPDQFFHDIRLPDGSSKHRPRDGQYLAQPVEKCDLIGIPLVGLGDRYRFCRDLAFAVGFLHKRDVCLGDISFANATYAVNLYPSVYLVDCDAFRLKGNASVVPQLHTPDWVPPEGSAVQSARTDLYKLGLFILRTLTPKAMSGQNRDPRWADPVLDPSGRQLLRRALASDRTTARTTAKEWFDYFNTMLQRRKFVLTPFTSRMPARTGT